jgi:hypothetical protein
VDALHLLFLGAPELAADHPFPYGLLAGLDAMLVSTQFLGCCPLRDQSLLGFSWLSSTSPAGLYRLASSVAVLLALFQAEAVKGTFLLCSKGTLSLCRHTRSDLLTIAWRLPKSTIGNYGAIRIEGDFSIHDAEGKRARTGRAQHPFTMPLRAPGQQASIPHNLPAS